MERKVDPYRLEPKPYGLFVSILQRDQHIKRNLIIFVTARLVNPAGQPVNQVEEEEEAVTPPELPAYKK